MLGTMSEPKMNQTPCHLSKGLELAREKRQQRHYTLYKEAGKTGHMGWEQGDTMKNARNFPRLKKKKKKRKTTKAKQNPLNLSKTGILSSNTTQIIKPN